MGLYLGMMSGTSMDAIDAVIGRELFNMQWLENKLRQFERRPQDVQATLLEFTAASVAAAARGARILGGVYRYA